MDFIFPSVFPELGESSLIVPVFWEENGRVLHLRRAHQCPLLDAVQSQHGISAQDVRFPQEPASPLLRTPDLTRKALHPDLTWAQRAVPGGEGGPWSCLAGGLCWACPRVCSGGGGMDPHTCPFLLRADSRGVPREQLPPGGGHPPAGECEHAHTHTHTHRGVKKPHGRCQRPVSPSLGIMGV